MKSQILIFNNREIAAAFWLLLVFIFALSKNDVRQSLKKFFKSLLGWKIQASILLMITITVGIVLLLEYVNLWNSKLIKDTVIWLLFAGIPLYIKWITSKSNKNIFKEIAVQNIKIVLLIEFIVNISTFSLIVELILVPSVTFIVMLNAFAKANNVDPRVEKLINGVQMIIGFFILFFASTQTIENYEQLTTLNTLRAFLLPILLSILSSPFVYFMALGANYGKLFSRLEMGAEKSSKLKVYAKLELIKYCKLSRRKVRKALNMYNFNLMSIQEKQDVDDMILKHQQTSNKFP